MDIFVVDDSAFMRKIVTDLLRKMPNVQVTHTARNGKRALALLEEYQPDVILLDVEMPILNGLDTLKIIKEKYDIPVIMLSALTNKEITIEALNLGAADFVEKPMNIKEIKEEWIREFYWKIKSLPQQETRTNEPVKERPVVVPPPSVVKFPTRVQAVVIGASTGGPKSLLKIIKDLPAPLRLPIFIVQHMPKGFTASFAQRMNEESQVEVKEAEHGEPIQNKVYLAPGDYHMVVRDGRIWLDQEEKVHGTRPAVDHLFRSAAQVYGKELVGLLLTGMGRDGAAGMKQIVLQGGYNIAQDKESSIVFGMPRHAIEAGVVQEVLGLEAIGTKLKQIVR
ncbi:protein-glutamate methylesterase/protein-glutamine glutaminase [Enterococcus sp. LJL98]